MKYLWIFDHDTIWGLIPLVSALWTFGGGGLIEIRRVGVAALISVSAFSLGANLWLCLAQFAVMFPILTLPYGDQVKARFGAFYPIWLGFMGAIFVMSMLPLVFIHHRWWQYATMSAVSMLLFVGTTASSQVFDFPKWKFCEIITGGVIGLAAAFFLI